MGGGAGHHEQHVVRVQAFAKLGGKRDRLGVADESLARKQERVAPVATVTLFDPCLELSCRLGPRNGRQGGDSYEEKKRRATDRQIGSLQNGCSTSRVLLN